MTIELTDRERQLLFQTVAIAQFQGQFAGLVLNILMKLREPNEASPSGSDADDSALHVEE